MSAAALASAGAFSQCPSAAPAMTLSLIDHSWMINALNQAIERARLRHNTDIPPSTDPDYAAAMLIGDHMESMWLAELE